MLEVFSTISEVTQDFAGIFLFLGAICVSIFGFWDFLSAIRRWRNQQYHSDNDYSRLIWPMEKLSECCRCFLRAGRCLILALVAFATTFMAASIAAATLALMVFGCDLLPCVVVFITIIIIAGYIGYAGQCLLDKAENYILECIETATVLRRRAIRRLRHTQRSVLDQTRLH